MRDVDRFDIYSVVVDPEYCPQCGTELGTREFDAGTYLWCDPCETVFGRVPVAAVHVVVHGDGEVLVLAFESDVAMNAGRLAADRIDADVIAVDGVDRPVRLTLNVDRFRDLGREVEAAHRSLVPVERGQHCPPLLVGESGQDLVPIGGLGSDHRVDRWIPECRMTGRRNQAVLTGQEASVDQLWEVCVFDTEESLVRLGSGHFHQRLVRLLGDEVRREVLRAGRGDPLEDTEDGSTAFVGDGSEHSATVGR
jgi:hypothetical protein